MPSYNSLKGYLLEEILAYLIQNTGFRLLVDDSQDKRELAKRGNGLVVQGRGGVHQVDVLGQLAWIPAFTYPIRLFVEAKCRKDSTGLPVIRNAVGVVSDINQNYSPIREGSNRLIKRYSYHYAIFSTSGFSVHAVDYAMAHQISLIDLSGPDFSDLRRLVDYLADSIANEDTGQGFVKALRFHVRQELGTWPEEIPISLKVRSSLGISEDTLAILDNALLRGIRDIGELFVGMSSGPFLLTFKSQNPQAFLKFADRFPSHRVIITWPNDDDKRQWTVQPAREREAYSLSFGLPDALAEWIFEDESEATRRALSAKERFLKDILIYRYVNGRDHLYRLTYDARATKRRTSR